MDSLKSIVKKIPVVRSVAGLIYTRVMARRFAGSQAYWAERYRTGGNSGAGSYSELARFKAEVLNEFVKEHQIATVIEHGCGDGNQLTLAQYPDYLGFDISPVAIEQCRKLFAGQPNRRFKLEEEYSGETADLSLSLDVVYHLVEDPVFEAYMKRLFETGTRFVIVYSSNRNEQDSIQAPHVRHRLFTEWVERKLPDWRLVQHIPNRFPHDHQGSFADFFIYRKS